MQSRQAVCGFHLELSSPRMRSLPSQKMIGRFETDKEGHSLQTSSAGGQSQGLAMLLHSTFENKWYWEISAALFTHKTSRFWKLNRCLQSAERESPGDWGKSLLLKESEPPWNLSIQSNGSYCQHNIVLDKLMISEVMPWWVYHFQIRLKVA